MICYTCAVCCMKKHVCIRHVCLRTIRCWQAFANTENNVNKANVSKWHLSKQNHNDLWPHDLTLQISMLIDVRDTGTKATLNIFEHELYTHTGQKERKKSDADRSVRCMCVWYGADKASSYLCCKPHSCSCCRLLPAKSHPAATWGLRSAPVGRAASSSAEVEITHTHIHTTIIRLFGDKLIINFMMFNRVRQ